MNDNNFPCNVCEKIEYCGSGDTCVSLEKYYRQEGEVIHMDTLNKKVINLSEIRVELIFLLDESKMASYKVVFPDELTYRDFHEATTKLNIDSEICENIEVITDSGTTVKFELDKIKKLKNDERWIIEWYDGELYEDENDNVQERKVGKVHREAFAHKSDLLNRLSEFEAINGEINIIHHFTTFFINRECCLNT